MLPLSLALSLSLLLKKEGEETPALLCLSLFFSEAILVPIDTTTLILCDNDDDEDVDEEGTNLRSAGTVSDEPPRHPRKRARCL